MTESPVSTPGPSRGGTRDAHDLEKLEDTLFQFHIRTGTLPVNKILNEEVVKVGDLPIAGGVYSDIWPGMWLGQKKVGAESSGLRSSCFSKVLRFAMQVALKALRNTKADDPRAQAVSRWIVSLVREPAA